jgi:hypothetical protein
VLHSPSRGLAAARHCCYSLPTYILTVGRSGGAVLRIEDHTDRQPAAAAGGSNYLEMFYSMLNAPNDPSSSSSSSSSVSTRLVQTGGTIRRLGTPPRCCLCARALLSLVCVRACCVCVCVLCVCVCVDFRVGVLPERVVVVGLEAEERTNIPAIRTEPQDDTIFNLLDQIIENKSSAPTRTPPPSPRCPFTFSAATWLSRLTARDLSCSSGGGGGDGGSATTSTAAATVSSRHAQLGAQVSDPGLCRAGEDSER